MMKIKWLVGLALVATMIVRFPDIVIPQVWDSSTEYAEDDEYDASFLGPLPFCVRDDAGAAKAADGQLQPFLCDNAGNLRVTGGGGGAVTNAGTFVVQEDGAALTALQVIDNFISGARGLVTEDNSAAILTALQIIDNFISGSRGLVTEDNSAAALTALQLIDNAISGAGLNITQFAGATVPIGAGTEAAAVRVTLPTDGTGIVGLSSVDNAVLDTIDAVLDTINAKLVAGTVIGDVNLGATDNAVLDSIADGIPQDPGLLHANSPTTEVASLLMIDGSGDTDIVTTNLSKSSAITITGSGRITKICLVVEGTSPFSEDGTIYFFDADPVITSNTADMTVAEAITVTSMISLKGADYNDNFATIKINCQATDESFHGITHVAYEQEGATTIANQDFQLHVWYRRDS